MTLAHFLAQTQQPDDSLSFLKWVAVTAMILGLVNGILWVVYLIKEIGNKRHASATEADLAECEQRMIQRIQVIEQRITAFEEAYEVRITRIYDKIETNTERMAKTLNGMSQQIGRLEGKVG